MPELPEVEIVTTALAELIDGRTIISAALFRERLAPKISPSRFETIFSETRVNRVSRRGKYIQIGLDNGQTLLVHLRMSGCFQVLGTIHENPKFTHAEFMLDKDERLVFSDQRHFGYMNVVTTDRLESTKELAKLAPEPFSDEFSKDYFKLTLRSSRQNIKALLLNQQKVCGLGNIYASEALFMSRINPEMPANTISSIKTNRLHDNIVSVLRKSIEIGTRGPVDPLNLETRYFSGDFEGEWLVYDRENQPCRNCTNPIRRLVHGGRSSYFCPRCQRK